jgi:tripartite-type tricarboxylate transporter receptor subunit TctC
MRRLPAVLAATFALVVNDAAAQLQGDRPIRLIVPFAAGSGTDVSARLLATSLSESMKRAIVIENRPGALATIGTDAAAKSPPDGHTLVATGSTAIAAAPSLFKSLPYDPVKDLAPVALVATAPLALFVSAESPVRTVQDLVALARAQPGKLNYASGNATGAVAGEMLKQSAGVDLFHVPYKNSPQALNDLAGGQVSMMFNDIAGATPLLKAGKIRAIAITSRTRSRLLPDVPTMAEAGFANYELYNWVGIFAPAKTPADTVAYLSREIAKVIAQPEFRERFERVGLDLAAPGTPAEFGAFVLREIDLWSRQIRAAGIQPE